MSKITKKISVEQKTENQVRQSMDRAFNEVLIAPGFDHQKEQRKNLIRRIDSNLSGLLQRVGVLVVERILQTEKNYKVTIVECDQFANVTLGEQLKSDGMTGLGSEVFQTVQSWVNHQTFALAQEYVANPPQWFSDWSTKDSAYHEELRLADIPTTPTLSDVHDVFDVLKVYELGYDLTAISDALSATINDLSLADLWNIGCHALGLSNLA